VADGDGRTGAEACGAGEPHATAVAAAAMMATARHALPSPVRRIMTHAP